MACDIRERPDGIESIADGIKDQLSLTGRGKSPVGPVVREIDKQTSDAVGASAQSNRETSNSENTTEGVEREQSEEENKVDSNTEESSMPPSCGQQSTPDQRPGMEEEREDSGHLADSTSLGRNLPVDEKARVPQEQYDRSISSGNTNEGVDEPPSTSLPNPLQEWGNPSSQIVLGGQKHQDLLLPLSENKDLQERDSGTLVKYVITDNDLFMESLCRGLDRDSRIIKCWRHLAYVLGVPADVSRKFDFYATCSPTEDLFSYLATSNPLLTVQQLKDNLRAVYRKDLVLKLEKVPDKAAVCELVSQHPEVLRFLASELDIDSRAIGNWKSLAARCGIPKNKVDQFGKPKHGPTDNLFYKLSTLEEHGKLTIKDLKGHLKEMHRNDVLLLFEKHSDTCLVKDVLKPDSELLGEVGHKLDKDVRALKGWRNLAYRLGIPLETYSLFDVSKEKKSPTRLLFEWLRSCKASLTIDDLLEAVKKIERNDVVEMIKKESKSAAKKGIAGTDSITTAKKGIAGTDSITTSQVYENLTKMKNETSGISSEVQGHNLKENAWKKGFQLRRDNSSNGNCMFSALADQVQRVNGDHIEPQRLREILVEFLEDNPKLESGEELVGFTGFERWSDYLKEMRKDNTWGDHVVLIAAANHFKQPIRIIPSLHHFKDIVIMPVRIPDEHVVNNPMVLGHIVEYHYVSLEPLPTVRENGPENPPYCNMYRPGSLSVGAQRTVPVLNPQKMTGSHIRNTREDKLKMCPTRLPFQIYGKLCRIMDTKRVFFDDFRMLAETFGMDRDDIRWLEQQNGPTDKILSAEKTLTVERLIQVLRKIEREDVAITLEKWVESES